MCQTPALGCIAFTMVELTISFAICMRRLTNMIQSNDIIMFVFVLVAAQRNLNDVRGIGLFWLFLLFCPLISGSHQQSGRGSGGDPSVVTGSATRAGGGGWVWGWWQGVRAQHPPGSIAPRLAAQKLAINYCGPRAPAFIQKPPVICTSLMSAGSALFKGSAILSHFSTCEQCHASVRIDSSFKVYLCDAPRSSHLDGLILSPYGCHSTFNIRRF